MCWFLLLISWLLPGAGHLFYKKYKRGTFWIISHFITFVFVRTMVVSSSASAIYFFVSFVITFFLVRLGSCFDIISIYKKDRLKFRNILKSSNNKTWFGVLLTFILPGLGHLYRKKFIHAILFASLYFVINEVEINVYAFSVTKVIYIMIVALHLIKQTQIHSLRFLRNYVSGLIFIYVFYLSLNLIANTYFCLVAPGYGLSMAPTIKSGDFLVVDKYTYRHREPYVGEIVLIKGESNQGDSEYVVKRIVATKNEFVKILNNTVYVNGKIRFKRADNMTKEISDKPKKVKTWVVPENHYFVIGDNLDSSIDSRQVGPIHKDIIRGRIIKILWPINHAGIVE